MDTEIFTFCYPVYLP